MDITGRAAPNHFKLAYRNMAISMAVAFYFTSATGVFVAQAFNPGKGGIGLTVLAAFTAAASAGLTTRTLFAPTITATYNGIRIRTLLRTRRYGWTEVERFQVVVKLVGSYNRKVLAITLTNGDTKSFNQLNGSPRRFGWVDEAVLKLNSYSANHLTDTRRLP